MADCEIEVSRSIWNNKHGHKIVVKPDGDGLGLIDIIQEETKNIITLSTEEARLVAAAVLATADELDMVEPSE